MTNQIGPLSPQDAEELAKFRSWLLGFLPEDQQSRYEEIGVKLAIINAYLKDSENPAASEGNLVALGACLGDALSQDLGLEWVTVHDGDDSYIALNKPGTSLLVNPLPIILSKGESGEKVDVYSLFDELNQHISAMEESARQGGTGTPATGGAQASETPASPEQGERPEK